MRFGVLLSTRVYWNGNDKEGTVTFAEEKDADKAWEHFINHTEIKIGISYVSHYDFLANGNKPVNETKQIDPKPAQQKSYSDFNTNGYSDFNSNSSRNVGFHTDGGNKSSKNLVSDYINEFENTNVKVNEVMIIDSDENDVPPQKIRLYDVGSSGSDKNSNARDMGRNGYSKYSDFESRHKRDTEVVRDRIEVNNYRKDIQIDDDWIENKAASLGVDVEKIYFSKKRGIIDVKAVNTDIIHELCSAIQQKYEVSMV